jgi:predicted RNA polymerase sigma factor
MHQQELIPHLFRAEFGRITAVLCRQFGFESVSVAEDIASETFLTALNTWPYQGVPENPQAWLYTVAKNKAKNALARNQLFNQKVSRLWLPVF